MDSIRNKSRVAILRETIWRPPEAASPHNTDILRRSVLSPGFRRRRRCFVIRAGVALEHSGDFAEESLFLFIWIPLRLDTARLLRVPIRAWRRQDFLGVATENPGEKSRNAGRLIAGVVRLGAGHEGNGVGVGTGRRGEPVGH